MIHLCKFHVKYFNISHFTTYIHVWPVFICPICAHCSGTRPLRWADLVVWRHKSLHHDLPDTKSVYQEIHRSNWAEIHLLLLFMLYIYGFLYVISKAKTHFFSWFLFNCFQLKDKVITSEHMNAVQKPKLVLACLHLTVYGGIF